MVMVMAPMMVMVVMMVRMHHNYHLSRRRIRHCQTEKEGESKQILFHASLWRGV
jgi:hypothetical protein